MPPRNNKSVHALLWRYRRDLVGQRLQMDRPVVEPNTTVVIAPAEGVLEPIFVVSRRKIFPWHGRASTLRPPNSGMKTDTRLGEHIVEFQHLAQIRVEDH